MPLSILVAVAGAARGRLERPPPVICVRALPFGHGLGESTMQALRAACHELGVRLVLDLVEYREDPAGDREVRRLLERSVNPA